MFKYIRQFFILFFLTSQKLHFGRNINYLSFVSGHLVKCQTCLPNFFSGAKVFQVAFTIRLKTDCNFYVCRFLEGANKQTIKPKSFHAVGFSRNLRWNWSCWLIQTRGLRKIWTVTNTGEGLKHSLYCRVKLLFKQCVTSVIMLGQKNYYKPVHYNFLGKCPILMILGQILFTIRNKNNYDKLWGLKLRIENFVISYFERYRTILFMKPYLLGLA